MVGEGEKGFTRNNLLQIISARLTANKFPARVWAQENLEQIRVNNIFHHQNTVAAVMPH